MKKIRIRVVMALTGLTAMVLAGGAGFTIRWLW